MPDDSDIQVEPVKGLPETPPEGERILWQGAPAPWALAKSALAAHWVGGYFGLLAVWRGLALGTTDGLAAGLGAVLWYAVVGLIAVGVLYEIGRAHV